MTDASTSDAADAGGPPGAEAGAPLRADASRNRQAVVAAGFEVLSRQPEASMAEIAAASGVGRTTVYRHFPTREALILALFDAVYRDSIDAIGVILDAYDAPADVFPRVAEVTIALGDRYGFLSAHRELAADFLRQPRADPMSAWIERRIADGTLRPFGVEWIQGMMIGLISAAHEEFFAGRESLADATRKLGDTLIAAFVV